MTQLIVLVAVFVGALLLGFALISRVPQLLHTPLMSLTNAISAVTLLGALLLFGSRPTVVETVLGGISILLASFNLVGGFAVTARMLRFFRKG